MEAGSAYSLSLSLKHNRCKLVHLDLSYNAIGEEGAKYIARALRTNSILRVLKLCNCGLRDEGGTALAMALDENTSVQDLALSGAGGAVTSARKDGK